LGGGVVPGSVVVMGGDPGVGKSTLMLQLAGRLAGKGQPVVYTSGEESLAQVRGGKGWVKAGCDLRVINLELIVAGGSGGVVVVMVVVMLFMVVIAIVLVMTKSMTI
jgi:KaiC/GvpD/RAD55 family RecA-like ATPase